MGETNWELGRSRSSHSTSANCSGVIRVSVVVDNEMVAFHMQLVFMKLIMTRACFQANMVQFIVYLPLATL